VILQKIRKKSMNLELLFYYAKKIFFYFKIHNQDTLQDFSCKFAIFYHLNEFLQVSWKKISLLVALHLCSMGRSIRLQSWAAKSACAGWYGGFPGLLMS
jgi:hypothetical protein